MCGVLFHKSKTVMLHLIAFLLATACEENSTNNKSADTTVTPERKSFEEPLSNDSGITVSFSQGSSSATTNGFMKDYNHPVLIRISIDKGDTLKAVLHTQDAAANIRFNQIFMPDGSADGPFGKELTYPLKQRGVYELKVGEDLMAEGPYKGQFSVTISLR